MIDIAILIRHNSAIGIHRLLLLLLLLHHGLHGRAHRLILLLGVCLHYYGGHHWLLHYGGHNDWLQHDVRLPHWYTSLLDSARHHGFSLGVSNKASAGRDDRAAAVPGVVTRANVRRCVTIMIVTATDTCVGGVTVVPLVCETVEDWLLLQVSAGKTERSK